MHKRCILNLNPKNTSFEELWILAGGVHLSHKAKYVLNKARSRRPGSAMCRPMFSFDLDGYSLLSKKQSMFSKKSYLLEGPGQSSL